MRYLRNLVIFVGVAILAVGCGGGAVAAGSSTNGNNTTNNQTVDRTRIHTVSVHSLANNEGLDIGGYLKEQFNLTRPASFVANDTIIMNNYVYETTNWAGQFDFSGVSWNTGHGGTLVTNQHIIVAAHFRLEPGTVLKFYSRNGTVYDRTIVDYRVLSNYNSLLTDACVEKLNAPLPDDIKVYAILDSSDLDYSDQFLGAPLLRTDQFKNVYINGVARINLLDSTANRSISYSQYSDISVPNFMFKWAVGGDSGHPQFFIVNDELVFASALYYYDSYGDMISPFSAFSDYQSALEKAIQDMQ